jgi:hypothetical protein
LPVSQVESTGATWLDRQLVARDPVSLSSSGFGREVHAGMKARVEYLAREGLARRQGQRIIFSRDLLETLRRRELDQAAARVASDSGLPYRAAAEGHVVNGVYRQRISLASGRFAMIDDGLGFSLVPWTPSLERHLGREVVGNCAHLPDRMDIRKTARAGSWLSRAICHQIRSAPIAKLECS